MDIRKTLTDDQIRTAIQICQASGQPVGGLLLEDYAAEIEARTAAPPKREDDAVVFRGAKAAAEYLGCGTRTIERYLADIPHYKIGAALFFRKSELDRWITTQEGGKR